MFGCIEGLRAKALCYSAVLRGSEYQLDFNKGLLLLFIIIKKHINKSRLLKILSIQLVVTSPFWGRPVEHL